MESMLSLGVMLSSPLKAEMSTVIDWRDLNVLYRNGNIGILFFVYLFIFT